MKKYQVLIVADSMRDFSEKAKPYVDRDFFMVPESLRVTESVIAVIFEKPAKESEEVPF